MRKWRATGRVFDRFEYLILLKTPQLDFGKWRLHQVEMLGCYCDHEGLFAQIDRAQRCGDVITLRGFATRIKRPDPTGKTHGVSLIVTSVHTHFANALRLHSTRGAANGDQRSNAKVTTIVRGKRLSQSMPTPRRDASRLSDRVNRFSPA